MRTAKAIGKTESGQAKMKPRGTVQEGDLTTRVAKLRFVRRYRTLLGVDPSCKGVKDVEKNGRSAPPGQLIMRNALPNDSWPVFDF